MRGAAGGVAEIAGVMVGLKVALGDGVGELVDGVGEVVDGVGEALARGDGVGVTGFEQAVAARSSSARIEALRARRSVRIGLSSPSSTLLARHRSSGASVTRQSPPLL
jgi:X-X-X-Leu-X-X-Gly heptad repeat protein